jgi:hypothetical protein
VSAIPLRCIQRQIVDVVELDAAFGGVEGRRMEFAGRATTALTVSARF